MCLTYVVVACCMRHRGSIWIANSWKGHDDGLGTKVSSVLNGEIHKWFMWVLQICRESLLEIPHWH